MVYKNHHRYLKLILFVMFFVVLFCIIFRDGGIREREIVYSTKYDLNSANKEPCRNIVVEFAPAENKLFNIELTFDDIPDNKSGKINASIYKDKTLNTLLYQAKLSLRNLTNKKTVQVYLNLPVIKGEKYYLTLDANADCTQVPTVYLATNNKAKEIINSSVGEVNISEGNIAINFGYQDKIGVFEKIFLCFVASIVFYSVWILTNILHKHWRILVDSGTNLAKTQQFDLVAIIIEVVLCSIVCFSCGIELQNSTIIVLFIISIISSYNVKQRAKQVFKHLDNGAKIFFFIVVVLWIAFSFVGQRLFIYPLGKFVSIIDVILYLMACVWSAPILISGLSLLNCLSTHCVAISRTTDLPTRKFIIYSIFIVIVPALINLVAYNPAISSTDTAVTMISNAKNLYNMDNWHPPFYCLLLRGIENIWDSTYAVLIFQYLFYVFVIMDFTLFLRKQGVKDWILLSFTAFISLSPMNTIHVNTIWKDIPYCFSLLLIFIVICKIHFQKKRKNEWFVFLEFVASLLGVYFFRKNGVVPFAIMIVSLCIVFWKNMKVWISTIICITIICIIQGPIYNHYQVKDNGTFGIYGGLGQDIMGVYYSGGSVSEDSIQMINQMTDYNNSEYNYKPTWSYASLETDIEISRFLKNYLGTFINNPILMIRSIIDREDVLWDIYKGEDSVVNCVNYTSTEDDDTRFEWNKYYPKRVNTSLTQVMTYYNTKSTEIQWLDSFQWRCGVYMLLGIICALYLGCYGYLRKNMILIFLPALGQILSLILSTGWSDFRYFWPICLLCLFTALITIMVAGNKGKNEI